MTFGPDSTDTPSARDRAVSDLLAFVLVFGIIITSVGVVYIFGLGALGDAQAAQQDRNAERAFSSMGASFNDLQTNRGQERLAELNPRGARMSIDESSPTISVDGISELNDQDMGAMHYDNDNTRISYELGAVFRSDDENSVMIREPEFVCRQLEDPDETRAIVSFVDASIEGDGPTAVGSESTMQIGAIQEEQQAHTHDNEIEITIEGSSHADAWARYFDANDWEGDFNDIESGDEVTATCENPSADKVVVRSTEVDLSLERGDS
ncbi:DUF7289 family protein [Natranaeroarchaeum aerophilus]|uniref:Uncharacterized protein n=1 Tax=Natranaeroarchaeum aerophilus TaxID=2917711 RepID=A0AAE3FTI8_9EURY|nr:hypothetical protein [Natranaeroarchaeum aerophilus]MCL9814339.1 hypothetical protein [Natranaeroarchaeum aerophilus]